MHVAPVPAYFILNSNDMSTFLNWRYWLMSALFFVGLYALFGNPQDELLWWQTKAIAAASFYALSRCARSWESLLFASKYVNIGINNKK